MLADARAKRLKTRFIGVAAVAILAMCGFAGVASAELAISAPVRSRGRVRDSGRNDCAQLRRAAYFRSSLWAATQSRSELSEPAAQARHRREFEAGRLVMILQSSGFPSASAPSGSQTDLNIATNQVGTWELARIAPGYSAGSLPCL